MQILEQMTFLRNNFNKPFFLLNKSCPFAFFFLSVKCQKVIMLSRFNFPTVKNLVL